MSANGDDFDFDFDSIKIRKVPVRLGGKRYLLVEASEETACLYRDATIRAGKLGPDGRVSHMDGLARAEPLLVARCLFEDKDGEPGKQVAEQFVLDLPARVVKPLFEKAKEISGLDKAEEAPRGNASPAASTGSSA